MTPMRELIPIQEMEAATFLFRGKMGNALARGVKRLCAVTKLEKLVNNHSEKTGWAFSQDVLEELGVDYELGGLPLSELPKGAFITVHNHPYGGIDGCALVNIFCRVDPSYKMMVNKILSRIWPLQENFITVVPTQEQRTLPDLVSVNGVKESIAHVRGGHPLGIFPAGAVSDLKPREKSVSDRDWQEPALKLIKRLNVPIVPVRFFDGNSRFFYRLGLIDWKVRLLRFPSEVFNKHGKRMRIGIGQVITPEQQEQFKSLEEFGDFLRESVYSMPEPKEYIRRTNLPERI